MIDSTFADAKDGETETGCHAVLSVEQLSNKGEAGQHRLGAEQSDTYASPQHGSRQSVPQRLHELAAAPSRRLREPQQSPLAGRLSPAA